MTYRLLTKGVLRLTDNLTITRDMLEWDVYRTWRKAGNTPEPMIVPPPAQPTADEVIAQLTQDVQRHLDATARARGYDNIMSASTYATSKNPRFSAEGQACVYWRDDVWAACYVIMADVIGGLRPAPTAQALIVELPVMVWP